MTKAEKGMGQIKYGWGSKCNWLGSCERWRHIKRCEGNWIGGFARFLGNCSSLLAELWALKDGLFLAKNLGFVSICIEVDVEMIVLLLNCTTSVNLIMEPLLSYCKNLLQAFTNPVVKHVYREANQCVDALANLGLNLNVPFKTFDYPPSVMVNLLAFEKAEFYCMRMMCC